MMMLYQKMFSSKTQTGWFSIHYLVLRGIPQRKIPPADFKRHGLIVWRA